MQSIPKSKPGQYMVELDYGKDRHVFHGYMSAARFADYHRSQGIPASMWSAIAGGWTYTPRHHCEKLRKYLPLIPGTEARS